MAIKLLTPAEKARVRAEELLKDRQDCRRVLIDRMAKSQGVRLEYWQGKLIRVEAQIRAVKEALANAN